MAGDDDVIKVKAKPKLKSAPPNRSKSLGPYKVKRPSSAKTSTDKGRSAREMWLESLQTGSGGLSSGRKPGQHPGKRTPTEYWMDTLRKTGQGHSTESTAMNSLSGTKRPSEGSMSFLSTSHYLRQMTGAEKPRKTSDPTNRPPPGTPAYKSQEEYYEEILALRKQISNMNSDNSAMKSKLRRTEEDNTKKDKEIEKLLDPSKSEEMRRTLTDRKPDAGSVIHSMKQKIVRLEQQLKEKEAAHKKLQSDIKATKIDEMKVQLEAFYSEIVRLQQGGPTKKGSKTASPAKESKETSAKVKALNETIIRINDTNARLQEENRLLKQDCDKHLEEAQVNTDVVDGLQKEYFDMNKRQLLSSIAKLEKKIEKMEYDNVSLLSDLDKRRDGKVEGKISLSGSVHDRIDQLDRRETELLEEKEKLEEALRKTKDDRAYYRKRCEELEAEVKELKKKIGKFTAGSDLLDGAASRIDGRKSNKHSSRHSVASDHSSIKGGMDRERQRMIDDFEKQHAARVIQKYVKKRQSDRREDDEVASLLQSTIRGHHSRKDRANQLRKQLDRPDSRSGRPDSRGVYDLDSVATDNDDMDDDVVAIQSAYRGHMSRKERNRRSTPSPSSGKRRQGSATRRSRHHDLDSEGESMDDDHLVSRVTTPPSRGKRPSSSRGSPSVFSSPRRRSPAYVEEDDDDIIF